MTFGKVLEKNERENVNVHPVALCTDEGVGWGGVGWGGVGWGGVRWGGVGWGGVGWGEMWRRVLVLYRRLSKLTPTLFTGWNRIEKVTAFTERIVAATGQKRVDRKNVQFRCFRGSSVQTFCTLEIWVARKMFSSETG